MPRLTTARVTIYRAYRTCREAVSIARHPALPDTGPALNAAVLSVLLQTIELLDRAKDLLMAEAADRRQLVFS